MEKEMLELRESLSDYLSRMGEPISEIVTNYRMGKQDEAGVKMIQLIEGLSWISQALHLTERHHSILVEEIRELLEDLMKAIENKDGVLTADLLEYELMPKLDDWKKRII